MCCVSLLGSRPTMKRGTLTKIYFLTQFAAGMNFSERFKCHILHLYRYESSMDVDEVSFRSRLDKAIEKYIDSCGREFHTVKYAARWECKVWLYLSILVESAVSASNSFQFLKCPYVYTVMACSLTLHLFHANARRPAHTSRGVRAQRSWFVKQLRTKSSLLES